MTPGAWIIEMLERAGGARPLFREREVPSWRACIALGVWWAVLILTVVAFVGRATKFIYVDF